MARWGPRTVWVLGDQLNRGIASLEGADPADTRVLMVVANAKLASKRFHRQRLHLVLGAMRAFAAELRREGFAVDERRAPTFGAGLAAHRAEHAPGSVLAMEPMSWDGLALLRSLGVEVVRSNQFLCHYEDFATWAGGRRGRLRMEDFYRQQRRRLGYLMDGDGPEGGRWTWTPRTASRHRATGGAGRRPRARGPPARRRSTTSRRRPSERPPTARGRSPAGRRWRACAPSSATGCPVSARIRTRCWRASGAWPTRSCRPT